MNITRAKELFDNDELEQALVVLYQIIGADHLDVQALLLRGRIFYKMQKWGDAMNDYNAVIELDAENSEAKLGLEMAKNILGYFTPEMFNP